MHLAQEFSISVDIVRSIFEAREIWNEKNVCQRGGEDTKVILIDNGGFFARPFDSF